MFRRVRHSIGLPKLSDHCGETDLVNRSPPVTVCDARLFTILECGLGLPVALFEWTRPPLLLSGPFQRIHPLDR